VEQNQKINIMKGFKNYQVTLEHVTDSNIDTFDTVICATEKQARKEAIKMSKSKRAKQLKTQTNHFGELPNIVRVWAFSNEDDNDYFVQGKHTFMYEDGVCTYSSVG